MGINVVVDEKLLEEAERLTGEHDRQKLLEHALQELIGRRAKLQALLDVAGKVQFYDGYDYKELRKTRYDTP